MKYIYITIALLAPLSALAQTPPANHALNPIGDASGGAPALYGRLIRSFLGAIGVAALFFFIIGGFKILTSQGNSDKLKSGKDTLVWAVIGLVVAFSSYILLRYVLEIITTPIA
ncbi:MAG: hypothetical protein CO042_02130 [Parcubacteria group bacterium CG_4_9_14_0_2_um_filter_41_8]|nr:MAG: hypothetical protein CO042_02130 [Parcubacteria group bacterium CG_4_9_14_0_2_um_filter_41_8]